MIPWLAAPTRLTTIGAALVLIAALQAAGTPRTIGPEHSPMLLATAGMQTIGLYNPATGTFFLRRSNSPGPADAIFAYGPPGAGWIPVVADWDGNGITTVGLYNPATSTFFLKNTNAPGPADLTVAYGPPGAGWNPLAGDWDALTVTELATGLEIPWALAFTPDGRLFLTERPGRVRVIVGGVLQTTPVTTLPVVASPGRRAGSWGLPSIRTSLSMGISTSTTRAQGPPTGSRGSG